MIVTMTLTKTMTVTRVLATPAEQEHAHDIDDQSQNRNRNGLVEVDRNGPDQSRNGLVADEDRDHRQHDSAGESRQIAKLAGAETEAVVLRMAARITIG